MKQEKIFFSNIKTISFSEDEVQVNGIKQSDELYQNETTKEYAYRLMRQEYSSVIKRQYENIVVLTGAGSSIGIGKSNKGKSMTELWEEIIKNIQYSSLEEFANRINFSEIQEDYTDLEALLSQAMLYQKLFTNDNEVREMIDKIKEIIKRNCTISITRDAPHHNFLRKLTSRKLKYSRTKIFTLNYDTLFEQAASQGGYVVIDGFSFTTPRQFNGVNYDYDIVYRSSHHILSEENFSPNVFHLYKPHGSLDWEENDGKIYKTDKVTSPLMIYPSSTKYESSYQQPFFEMMSRFQQETRSKNTLLITIGFSFGDVHIKTMVEEALMINPSITLLIVSPDAALNENYEEFRERSFRDGNVYLISEKFDDFVANFPQSEVYIYENEGGKNID